MKKRKRTGREEIAVFNETISLRMLIFFILSLIYLEIQNLDNV